MRKRDESIREKLLACARELVEAGGQLPLGQLATKLACVKSNATQLVDRLTAEKLVRRVPDPEDRRSILAELTTEGRQCYAAGLTVVQHFERLSRHALRVMPATAERCLRLDARHRLRGARS